MSSASRSNDKPPLLSAVTPRNFGFRLRQDPAPQNFLGAMKLMFPNPWNVYLHDTPERVDRAMRAGREETVHFRPDVYGRDEPVAEALERTPPGTELPSRSVRAPFGS